MTAAHVETQVVLKALSEREFFNELLAWAVGAELQLPIPEVFLVAGPDAPEFSKAILLGSGDRLCFGSALAPYPSFSKHMGITQPVPPMVSELLRQALSNWTQCGETIAFDTWIANIDRNAGNLLFAQNGKHVLIDHGWCMTGPKWMPSDLDPAKAQMNKLASTVAQLIEDAQHKRKVADGVIDFAVRAAAVKLSPVVTNLKTQGWIDDAEADAILKFLAERIGSIVAIARRQAGV